MRIVSLLASGTEIVCALGAGAELVGRSHECDRPGWVTRLPALSRPTFDTTGSSAEIDRLVRARVRSGAPLYEVEVARLEALAPDVVITQAHCRVCAVSPEEIGRGPTPRAFREIVLGAGTLAGILGDVARVAAAIGRDAEGERLASALRAEAARWEEATRPLPRPRVACLEWIEPVFLMANWSPEIVRHAGGTPIGAQAGFHSTEAPWEEVQEADPDVVVVAPCGFSLARAQAELPTLRALPGWSALRAVREGRVYVADGNVLFNRSGPSAFETIGVLAEMLHPHSVPPQREGELWARAER
jgi:iron complex transport system substrate-binding protein